MQSLISLSSSWIHFILLMKLVITGWKKVVFLDKLGLCGVKNNTWLHPETESQAKWQIPGTWARDVDVQVYQDPANRKTAKVPVGAGEEQGQRSDREVAHTAKTRARNQMNEIQINHNCVQSNLPTITVATSCRFISNVFCWGIASEVCLQWRVECADLEIFAHHTSRERNTAWLTSAKPLGLGEISQLIGFHLLFLCLIYRQSSRRTLNFIICNKPRDTRVIWDGWFRHSARLFHKYRRESVEDPAILVHIHTSLTCTWSLRELNLSHSWSMRLVV